MKLFNLKILSALFCICLTLISCGDDDSQADKGQGTISILFDNKIGQQSINIAEAGSTDYQYTDENNQEYNISLLAYYISKIELFGPDGVTHSDPLAVGPAAEDVKGYYHVITTTPNSNVINLDKIEAGTYSGIRFTVGIDESGVQEGAAGGVLDPANGAWFWNWNAGYIGFGVEGNASNSGQEYVDWGNGFETLEGTFAVHVGGWKDVEPEEGEDPKFVNNLKVIELDFGADLNIESGLRPEAHINVDLAELLKGNDFSSTYAVHRPDLGKPFANKFINVFELDHVHQ